MEPVACDASRPGDVADLLTRIAPDLVVLSAFQMHNVRLLLLSGIGTAYDPNTGQGVVGKNYAYQMCGITTAFFKEDVQINPFIGAGAAGMRVIDEFNSDHYDHSKAGFVGGAPGEDWVAFDGAYA